MAVINLKTMYQDILQELTLGDNENTEQVFLRSVNRADDELSAQNDLAREIAHVDSIDDTVSDTYLREYMLRAGTAYYMTRSGASPAEPRIAKVVYDDTDRRWKDAKADYWTLRLNALNATGTSNVFGLGHVDTT